LISEDELKRGEEELQKITDRHIEEIDKIGGHKEKEILEV
jgi:ribosome recycling factor